MISKVIQAEIFSKEPEKKKKLLREVIVKIGLKQEDGKNGITIKALLDSGVTELVISSDFTRKNKFKKKKLKKLIYMRIVDSIFNHEEPIKHIVKVELFYRRYKEKMEIDVIRGQK